MIHRLGSDLASFKTLKFKSGLNILLADKNRGATDGQTRNGAGKTSFVELVHFLFGANANKGDLFRSEALEGWTFDVDFDIAGANVRASRTGSAPGKIAVDGATETWPVAPRFNKEAGRHEFSNEDWKLNLGKLWFDLPIAWGEESFTPSFRSLFSYFARRQEGGGFQKATQHAIKQQTWDEQVSISYLLGLDWRIPARFQQLRAAEKTAGELRKAAKSGGLGSFYTKAAELRT